MARSCEFEPKTRSTAVPVHLTSPVARSRPRKRRRIPTPSLRAHVQQVHEEVVGQHLGALGEDAVRTAGVAFERAQAAISTVISERSASAGWPARQQLLRRERLVSPEVIAESVERRLEHRKRIDVRLLLRGVVRPRRERHVTRVRRPSPPARRRRTRPGRSRPRVRPACRRR